MTKISFRPFLVALAVSSSLAVLSLAVAGCGGVETEVTVYGPEIVLAKAAVTAAAEGGNYSLIYNVVNPSDDGSLSCTGDSDWLGGFDCSVDGSVSFTVGANPGEEARIGVLTLTYSSSSGSSSAAVTVAQNSASAPVVTVSPSAVPAGIDGGSCSFSYSIENAGSDADLSCTADAAWIGDIDLSMDGTVGFTVEAYDGTSVRTAELALVCTTSAGSGEALVTVVQDHRIGDPVSGDVSEVTGTYTCTATAYDSSAGNSKAVSEQTWTVRIFPDNYYDGYDLCIDGVCPSFAGYYDIYGDNRASARAYYQDGVIIVPSHTISTTTTNINGISYYLGYTPCTSYNPDKGFYYSSEWPSTTFTYDAGTDTWVSDYGLLAVACTTTSISSYTYLLDAAVPPVTLAKVSESTDAAPCGDCPGSVLPVAAPVPPVFPSAVPDNVSMIR